MKNRRTKTEGQKDRDRQTEAKKAEESLNGVDSSLRINSENQLNFISFIFWFYFIYFLIFFNLFFVFFCKIFTWNIPGHRSLQEVPPQNKKVHTRTWQVDLSKKGTNLISVQEKRYKREIVYINNTLGSPSQTAHPKTISFCECQPAAAAAVSFWQASSFRVPMITVHTAEWCWRMTWRCCSSVTQRLTRPVRRSVWMSGSMQTQRTSLAWHTSLNTCSSWGQRRFVGLLFVLFSFCSFLFVFFIFFVFFMSWATGSHNLLIHNCSIQRSPVTRLWVSFFPLSLNNSFFVLSILRLPLCLLI